MTTKNVKTATARKATVAKAAPKATIKILKPGYQFGAKETKRNAAWQLCKRTKDATAYAKAGGPRKYLPRWARAGAIAY